MKVRGAPLIGVTAAYALAILLKKSNDEYLNKIYETLSKTRPTAVNLKMGSQLLLLKDIRKTKISERKNIAHILWLERLEIMI